LFFSDDHGGEAVEGSRDAYWVGGRSAVTNSLLLSVLWAVGPFVADRNVQHWAEPRQSAGVGNSTRVLTFLHHSSAIMVVIIGLFLDLLTYFPNMMMSDSGTTRAKLAAFIGLLVSTSMRYGASQGGSLCNTSKMNLR